MGNYRRNRKGGGRLRCVRPLLGGGMNPHGTKEKAGKVLYLPA
jgi:hypothetical protein